MNESQIETGVETPKSYGTVEPIKLYEGEDDKISFIRGFTQKYYNDDKVTKADMIDYILGVINVVPKELREHVDDQTVV